jgi:hypothetical protein
VSSASATYSFTDDSSSKTLVSKTETPAPAPLGSTNVLLGLQSMRKTALVLPLFSTKHDQFTTTGSGQT